MELKTACVNSDGNLVLNDTIIVPLIKDEIKYNEVTKMFEYFLFNCLIATFIDLNILLKFKQEFNYDEWNNKT